MTKNINIIIICHYISYENVYSQNKQHSRYIIKVLNSFIQCFVAFNIRAAKVLQHKKIFAISARKIKKSVWYV